MKISVNDQELFTLSEIQKKVIQNDIPTEVFQEDMKRRILYIIMHKYEQCFERLKKEWTPKLVQEGLPAIPTNPEQYAQLVFSHPEYKNRSQRDAKEKGIE